MDLLLQALGLGLVCALAAAAAVVWLYKYRLKRTYLYHLAAAVHRFPQRLRLRRLEPFAWRKPERAAHRVELFRTLGFVDLGGFSLDEIPDARLFALWQQQNGLVGIVHEQEQLGTWSDVMRFAPGPDQPVLASSILQRSHFFFLPGSPKIHCPDAGPGDLGEAVLAAVEPGTPARTVTRDNFAALYETAFAQAVDARLLEPLADYELRRLAMERGRPCGNEIDEQEFHQLKQLLPLAVANELRLACAAQFVRETALPASEWQQARGRLLVVHDRTPLARLAQRLVYGVYLSKALKGRLRSVRPRATPRQDFANLNARLPAWQRYKNLGAVTRPIPADIWQAPREEKTACGT